MIEAGAGKPYAKPGTCMVTYEIYCAACPSTEFKRYRVVDGQAPEIVTTPHGWTLAEGLYYCGSHTVEVHVKVYPKGVR